MRKWLHNIREHFQPVNVGKISERFIVVNLYITQSLLFIIGMTIIFFQPQSLLDLLKYTEISDLAWAALFCGAAVLLNIAVTPLVPKELQKDDEVNVILAKRVPLWHLIFICAVVGFSEELLFRGAVQYAVGAYWTSIIFALIHVHYLRHWVLTGSVFLISYGLGLLYDYTGNLWISVIAHAAYDFIVLCLVRYDIGGHHEQ